MKSVKNQSRYTRMRRRARIRARVRGTAARPRLSVFRSNRYIYAQLVDDDRGVTLASATDITIKGNGKTKVARAAEVGSLLAQRAKEANITDVVFDRGGFIYTGRVKALAEAAREAGLAF